MRALGLMMTVAIALFDFVGISIGQEEGEDDIVYTIPVDEAEDGGEFGEGGNGSSTTVKCFVYANNRFHTCSELAQQSSVVTSRTTCDACIWNDDLNEWHCPKVYYDTTTISGLEGKGRLVNQVSSGGKKFEGNYNIITCWQRTSCGGKCVAADPNNDPVLADCPNRQIDAKIREPKLEAGSCN
jgi:hypothetical protein